MDSELSMTTPGMEELVADMKSMSGTGVVTQIVLF